MTKFQWITLTFVGLLLLGEVIGVVRGRRKTGWPVRLIVLLAAVLAICFPDEVTYLAKEIGIGRGTDLVLYLFVLAFLVVSFYFYARTVQLQRQVTQLVRHIAIQEARKGDSDNAAPKP